MGDLFETSSYPAAKTMPSCLCFLKTDSGRRLGWCPLLVGACASGSPAFEGVRCGAYWLERANHLGDHDNSVTLKTLSQR